MFDYSRIFLIALLVIGIGANASNFASSSAISSDLSLSGDVSVDSGEDNSDSGDNNATDHSGDEKSNEGKGNSNQEREDHSGKDKGKSHMDDGEDQTNESDKNKSEQDNKDQSGNQNIEIEVKVKNGKSLVKIESDNQKSRFVIDTDVEDEILAKIEQETGLNATQIKSTWNFEAEAGNDHATMREQKQAAKENADQIITGLQQKITNLENRLQNLLNSLERGKYYGPVEKNQTQSYTVSFSGNAVSRGNATASAEISGQVFLESTFITPGVSQFKVTGCQITVGDTFYDCVFGHARAFSAEVGTKNSILIIAQIMDDEGQVDTMKIRANTGETVDQLQGPTDLSIGSAQGQIASKWKFEAQGTLSPITQG